MIDHDAAADLWDRYKRGERNVFTRRLYTLQGQKTFDEIRKKYRADREFKQTVDRYIGEFERLLDEVSRDDRGQVVARTYLTSETGKVYTMLAHAAGRFDESRRMKCERAPHRAPFFMSGDQATGAFVLALGFFGRRSAAAAEQQPARIALDVLHRRLMVPRVCLASVESVPSWRFAVSDMF